MLPSDARAHLVYALRDDLIGPDPDDPRDAAHATETLSSSPSHWYLTGFLAPSGQKLEEKEDDTADEDIASALDSADDGEAEAPVARRPVFPSSLGISVLIGPATRTLEVRVTYGTYAPGLRRDGKPPTDPPPDKVVIRSILRDKPARHERLQPRAQVRLWM